MDLATRTCYLKMNLNIIVMMMMMMMMMMTPDADADADASASSSFGFFLSHIVIFRIPVQECPRPRPQSDCG